MRFKYTPNQQIVLFGLLRAAKSLHPNILIPQYIFSSIQTSLFMNMDKYIRWKSNFWNCFHFKYYHWFQFCTILYHCHYSWPIIVLFPSVFIVLLLTKSNVSGVLSMFPLWHFQYSIWFHSFNNFWKSFDEKPNFFLVINLVHQLTVALKVSFSVLFNFAHFSANKQMVLLDTISLFYWFSSTQFKTFFFSNMGHLCNAHLLFGISVTIVYLFLQLRIIFLLTQNNLDASIRFFYHTLHLNAKKT